MKSELLNLPSGREIILRAEKFRKEDASGKWQDTDNWGVKVEATAFGGKAVYLPKMDLTDLAALGKILSDYAKSNAVKTV